MARRDRAEKRRSGEHLIAAELSRAKQLASTQREANTELVKAAVRAQEDADESRAAEGELRSTAEFRERLIGIIGHDLRSPLSGILMSAEVLLARGSLKDDDARVVRGILSSGKRMMRLIGDLTEFTRARLGGGIPLERTDGDMRAICSAIASEHASATAAPVRWSAEGDVSGTWDCDRLTEALSNLVGNAIEHATPGTPVVVEALDDGDRVCVTVRNEGPPIPAEALPYIFDAFRRGAAPTTRRGGNLGLGLFIASEIVRSHGGRIEAASSGGVTTFTIRLPRRAALDSEPFRPTNAAR